MTDILPDTNFVQNLAENHKSIFQKLLEQLKQFTEDLREYFKTIGRNRSPEANALKEQEGYIDSIVKMYDKIAAEAVESYQAAKGTETKGELLRFAQDDSVKAQQQGRKNAADYDPETASVKQQIENSRDELNKMDAVATVNAPAQFTGKEAAVKWAVGMPALTLSRWVQNPRSSGSGLETGGRTIPRQ